LTVRSEKVTKSEISEVLIGGLAVSVTVEILGILAYYGQSGTFNFDYSPQWQMTGQNFFAYAVKLLSSVAIASPTALMALGIVLLMMTSYARVFTTVLYFLFGKNLIYTVISLFVFLLLTIALIVH
jgi:uncharacterized membrane protein